MFQRSRNKRANVRHNTCLYFLLASYNSAFTIAMHILLSAFRTPRIQLQKYRGVFHPITMFMILIMLSFVASAHGNFASLSLWLPDKYVCQYWRSAYFIIQFMPSAYMTNHGNQSNISCTNDG